ncbi:MAG TPA: hypothetical protein VFY69_05980 [Solirubrobacterales bacterium]|nr:hypothetical protein [Solirubrobacterales bacterium]
MKARGHGVLLLCVLAALLAMPAAAGAKPDYKVRPGSFFLQVRLPDRDGWSLEVSAEGHRQIYLIAERGATSVRYRVAGRASSRLLKADFGPFGRVDIRMDLDEVRPLYPPLLRKLLHRDNCRGREPVEMTGRFQGIVDFEGEEKVAGVFTRKGGAAVERTFRTVCKQREKKPSKKKKGKKRRPRFQIEANLFSARAHSGGRTISFGAFGFGIDSEVLFGIISGSVHERHGRVRIMRRASELAEGPMLEFSRKGHEPATVEVKPPRPFSGAASYRKRTGSPATWSGALSIPLPGVGEVPLAGPEFRARLCQIETTGSEGLEDFYRCLGEIQTLSSPSAATGILRDLYGSGSHSQPLALARLSSLR